MVTPFDVEGALDLDAAASLARYLVDHGSDALVLAGSTGEGSALSDEEKLSLFAAVAEVVTVPVVAGTSGADTAHSQALTREASALGVAGILATTPSYTRPSQSGVAAHLTAVARATNLPVMLYDIPSRTGRKIAASTTIAVVEENANVVALKDASGDLPAAATVRATLGEGFDLYSGDDALTLPFLAIGATGLVSVAAHWAGDEFAAMIVAAHAGDWDRARSLNSLLAPSCAFASTEAYPNPVPAKAAMRALGLAVGQCRLPHTPSDDVIDTQAHTIVRELLAARG